MCSGMLTVGAIHRTFMCLKYSSDFSLCDEKLSKKL